ncbi:hypothetical protein IP88_09120 [alpha proteobacterium AAP81b]|nr:hypothetical protein IP88_09120 [alpha proteobacterium AAP81b]
MQIRPAFAAFLAAFALISCTPKADGGAACVPEAARRWIVVNAADSLSAAEDRGALHVYVDGSASMVGFVRGGTRGERPFADLIGMLPQLPGIDHSAVTATRFDRRLTPLSPAELIAMEEADAYLCPAGEPDCDHQESHIDAALADAARQRPGTLSVILTDLWIDNTTLNTSDAVALAAPLDAIFARGDGIAIYGYESPFDGRVSGLPSGRGDVRPARHHFYMIAIAPPARLEALRRAMALAPSASVRGKAKYALFTRAPAINLKPDDRPLAMPGGGPLAGGIFLTHDNVRVQQFDLDRSAGLRAATTGGAPAQWRGPAADAVAEGAVWTGPVRGGTRVFRQADDNCAPASWRPLGENADGWQGSAFALDPGQAARRLTPGIYMLVGEVRRTALDSPNPASKWLRDWSFNAASEAEALTRPVMPTLNLDETARLLEAALIRAAEADPVVTGGFAVALRVK